MRSFFRGDEGFVGYFADRLLGSPAIYGHEEREVEQSVNYVTCHDGFTLNDLVSYSRKHNEANGEDNRDGTDDNRSWNCGVEGPSDDPAVEKLRNRQVKNFLTITMLSAGIPMILMGDEVRRTQFGNNNAYCQDNETSWFDWGLLAKHADVHRFVTLLNARRRLRSTEIERQRISLNRLLRGANLTWHGVKVGQPDWAHIFAQYRAHSRNARRKINRSPDRRTPIGKLSISSCRRSTVQASHGGAGSTPLSTRRRISFTGKLLYQFLHPPYGRNPGR